MEGTTKTGFNYTISQEQLDNYELVEAIAELDDNPLAITKVINQLLGKEQAKALKNHIRESNGVVSATKMSDEIVEILQNQKNS